MALDYKKIKSGLPSQKQIDPRKIFTTLKRDTATENFSIVPSRLRTAPIEGARYPRVELRTQRSVRGQVCSWCAKEIQHQIVTKIFI